MPVKPLFLTDIARAVGYGVGGHHMCRRVWCWHHFLKPCACRLRVPFPFELHSVFFFFLRGCSPLNQPPILGVPLAVMLGTLATPPPISLEAIEQIVLVCVHMR